MKLPFEQIKHPLVVIENGMSIEVWWEGDEGTISYWSECPDNYPRFCIGHHCSKEEALDELDRFIRDEGWEIVDGSRENIEKISYRR